MTSGGGQVSVLGGQGTLAQVGSSGQPHLGAQGAACGRGGGTEGAGAGLDEEMALTLQCPHAPEGGGGPTEGLRLFLLLLALGSP